MSVLGDKSHHFTLNTLKDIDERQNKEYSLLRSATLVGANMEEGQHADSKIDLPQKLFISGKEANEKRNC